MRNTAQYPITLDEMRNAASKALADFVAAEDALPPQNRPIGGIHGAALAHIPRTLSHMEALVLQMGKDLGYTDEKIADMMKAPS